MGMTQSGNSLNIFSELSTHVLFIAAMNTIAFIFARGGSKGVPRKNLRPLAGKPLIAYAIETGLASPRIDRVVVSTDDREIASVAKRYGAEVPFIRPAELAADTAPERLAWQHAIREIRRLDGPDAIDVFVSIPPTAPLRSVADVDACIETLIRGDADTVIAVTEAQSNPWFSMFVVDDDGEAQLVMGKENWSGRRQEAPVVYDATSVAYVARPEVVLNTDTIFDGKLKAIKVPVERAVDIDSELDFQYAEFIIQRLGQGLRQAG